MVDINMNRAIDLSGFTVFILFLILTYPAFSQEVVLCMHENYTMDDCILQVEDIDSQEAEVWVSILGERQPSSSMVLGINETLTCGKVALMVKKFYAGENYDIVCLKIIQDSISG